MKKLFSFITILLCLYNYAAEYYWVGGSGNWTDINHWRTTSGGTLTPSVVPGSTDNVYFDSNSGFTSSSKKLTLNTTGECKNITFLGNTVAPEFIESGSQSLNIYGSSVWQSGMKVEISKIYYKNTNTAKTIRSNGVTTGKINGSVNFEEDTTIDLLDDLIIGNTLSLNAGTLNTKNNTVTIGFQFTTAGNTQKTINLGSSNIYMNGVNSSFRTNSSYVTLNAGSSHIYFTGNLTNLSANDTYGIVPFTGQTFNNITYGSNYSTSFGSKSKGANFNQVNLKSNAKILGSNTIQELNLTPTKNYIFESNYTTTIKSKLTLHTLQCAGWSTVTSTDVDTPAKIFALDRVLIDISGLILKDVHVSGGALFQANNSVNDGNNEGWTFPSYTGQDLFWVGGSGNWNDRTHWSQTSGGTGGYCIPGPADNTFFNIASGFTTASNTVTIDNTSYTKDITFSGSVVAPILNENGSQILNIYGSSEWQAGMGGTAGNVRISNIYYRNTNSPKIIKSNGVITGASSSRVYFEEQESITLADDLHINLNLILRAGTWNTKNHKVTIKNQFTAESTQPKVINLGNSNIYLTNSSSFFNTNLNSVTVNAGGSHIYFTGSVQNINSSYGMLPYINQTFNNITYESNYGVNFSSSEVKANFNRVELKSNASIKGDNTIKELILHPNKTYVLDSNHTTTITSLLSLTIPQCDGWATINSSTSNTSSKIIAAEGVDINVSGVIMSDIQVSGGANFIANNSIDNGNNTGWRFPTYTGVDLYWIGGSGNWNDKSHWSSTSGGNGGYCVPGPGDNTFFNINSGFTSTSKTITLANTSYTNNITFSGSQIAPKLIQNGNQVLNIYGSSEWQSGMDVIDINQIYYKHSLSNSTSPRNLNTSKTITSNGVTTGTLNSKVYLEEQSSINLIDNLNIGGILSVNAGTFNTNNKTVTIGSQFITGSNNRKTINLGESNIYLIGNNSSFRTNYSTITLNAGTSHIYFTGNLSSLSTQDTYGLIPFLNQTFYNVTYGSDYATSFGSKDQEANFNQVDLKSNANIYGNNTFNELIFAAGKTYKLETNKIQTIDNWVAGGTPCGVTFIESTSTENPSRVKVIGNNREFNFVNLKGFTADTNSLHFGEQSTIDSLTTTNITNDPYNPGAFDGLEEDWIDHIIKPGVASTRTISSSAFYGNRFTSYKWFKIGGANSSTTNVISTAKDLDILPFGFGEYKIEVDYGNGCNRTSDILIKALLRNVPVNPKLKFGVY